jgi:hypothetical protein
MTTLLSANGSLEIPETFRKTDSLQAGQRCDIERVGQGDYRVRVSLPETPAEPQEGLVALLRSCPVKGFFAPMARTETTDDLQSLCFE